MALIKWRRPVGKIFRLRLTVWLFVVILLIMGVGAAAVINETEEAFRVSAEAQGLAFSRSFAMMGGQAVLENLFMIQEALDQQIKNLDITEIDVIDTDDMIVAAKHPDRIGMVLKDEDWQAMRSRQGESLNYRREATMGQALVIAESLFDQGGISAWIRVEFSLSNIHREALYTVGRMVLFSLALAAAGIFAVQFVLRRMARLLHQIVGQLQGALGSPTRIVDPEGASKMSTSPEDEIEHLADVAASMVDLLKNQSNSLQALTFSLDQKVRERTAELDQQRRKAEEASRLKSAFLANLNHGLRTPLNGILGMVSMLEDHTVLNDQQREQVRILRSCADSLRELINDVLDLSKIEAGKVELDSLPFEPRMVVEGTMDILGLQAAEKGIELVCRVDHTLPRFVKGDAKRIREILLNLAGNALKFTQKGTVEVHAGVVSEKADSLLVKFSVQDSGIGVPQDKLELIFEPFVQIPAPVKGWPEGTGLGLSICKRLVEFMGGQVGVSSEPGVGSTFWCTVWFKRCDEMEIPSPPSPYVPNLCGARILLVDHNAVSRSALKETLLAEGALCEATEGRTALLLLKESAAADRPFDLMLFDDGPSGSDAEHLVEAVRTDESLRATPLILMGPVTRCREAGWVLKHQIAATLTKPVRTSQLMAALSLVLHRSPKVATELPPGTTAKAGLTQQERGDRILLVEDNEANQMVVRWFLHETGYWVDVVATGQEALEALKCSCYDVLLLDIHLPDFDGLEVAEMIRRDPRWASLPILALTAATMPEDQAHCLAAGITSYLVKPLDRHTLVAAVANALVSSRVGSRTGRASLEDG